MDENLDLNDIIALGGDHADYEMLKDFNSNEPVKKTKSNSTKKFDKNEFQDLIAGLGFQALMPEKKSKKKLKLKKDKKEDITAEENQKKIEDKEHLKLKPKTSTKKKPLQDDSVSSTTIESPNKTTPNVAKTNKKPKKKSKSEKKIINESEEPKKIKKKKKSVKSLEEPATKVKPSVKKTEITFDVDVGVLSSRLITKAAGTWHENFSSDVVSQVSPTEPYVKALKVKAMMLLDNELKIWKTKNEKKANASDGSGNANWMKTVSTAGTLSDRVAALSLMIQGAQIHNFHCLETLLSMAKKKGRREAIIGLESLRDLFLGDLLPDNRRLRLFYQHPLDLVLMSLKAKDNSGEWSRESCQRRLIVWAYEQRLKDLVGEFVELIKVLAHDALEASKTKSMKVALELILNKPEQEKSLLSILVNKLGDPKYKIASKSLHMLNCIVQKHPLMQGIIVNEVRDLLLRPNLAPRAQYYCVCFLSSQILSHDRKEVAQKLIQIYISFFKALVNKKNADNKMLSALLTGVNRAFPYANMDDGELLSELDVLFRTVHVASLNTAVQALVLLFQVFTSRCEVSDRFYNALYSVLMHNEVPVCTSRHPMLLNLVYRALKADPSEPRVQSFIKRLMQMCSLQLPPFCAAVVTLVAQLSESRPSLTFGFLGRGGEINEKEKVEGEKEGSWLNEEEGEEHFVDAPEDSDVEEKNQEITSESSKIPSWTHKHQDSMKRTTEYNPLYRNPQYSGSEKTALWELHAVGRHFHPTVTLFAKNLINQKFDSDAHIGNPLDDYTLIKFLDRFVYRNPKSQEQKQLKKKGKPVVISTHRRKHHATFNNIVPVNSVEFLLKKKLSPEEVFFHKYFSSQAGAKGRSMKQEKKMEKEEEESDVESLDDEEFHKFMGSDHGQKEIDKELNFADHIYKNKNKNDDNEIEEQSEDEFDDEETNFEEAGYGFNMEEGEEDLLDEAGVFMEVGSDQEEDQRLKSNKRKNINDKKQNNKRRKEDLDEFSLMLEENANDKFDSVTSSAVKNSEKASAKQLQWERKQETREILARKRERAKKAGGGRKKGKRH